MTSRRSFLATIAYWLQGFFELSKATTLDAEQTTAVKNHLSLVFIHEIDPATDGGDPVKITALNEAHNPPFNRPPGMRC